MKNCMCQNLHSLFLNIFPGSLLVEPIRLFHAWPFNSISWWLWDLVVCETIFALTEAACYGIFICIIQYRLKTPWNRKKRYHAFPSIKGQEFPTHVISAHFKVSPNFHFQNSKPADPKYSTVPRYAYRLNIFTESMIGGRKIVPLAKIY